MTLYFQLRSYSPSQDHIPYQDRKRYMIVYFVTEWSNRAITSYFSVVSLLGSFYVFYFCEETPLVGANLSYENALQNDTTLDILGDYNRATFENSCSGVGSCNCTLGIFSLILIRWPIRMLNYEFQLSMIQSASMVVSHFSPRATPVVILATYRKLQIAVVLDHLLKMTPLAPLVVTSANEYLLEVVIRIWKDAILKFSWR